MRLHSGIGNCVKLPKNYQLKYRTGQAFDDCRRIQMTTSVQHYSVDLEFEGDLVRWLKHLEGQLTSRISSPISSPLVDDAIPFGLMPAMKHACGSERSRLINFYKCFTRVLAILFLSR